MIGFLPEHHILISDCCWQKQSVIAQNPCGGILSEKIFQQMATPVLTFVAVDRNHNLRPNCVATAVLFLSVASIAAQTAGRSQAHARIAGRVLDEQGHPLKNISVHAVQDETGMYKPAVDSNEDGHFVIEDLKPGTYSVFGESDAAAYPDTALPFYSNENPIKATLGNFGTATIVLVLGPKAGVLRGTVFDKATGKVISSPHSAHFIVRKVSNREDSIEFAGPTRFRWLIPPTTDVTLGLPRVTSVGFIPIRQTL